MGCAEPVRGEAERSIYQFDNGSGGKSGEATLRVGRLASARKAVNFNHKFQITNRKLPKTLIDTT